jgi:hypothetical protein
MRTQLQLTMKKFAGIIFLILFVFSASAKDNIQISFSNDYKDVYHLSLIIYTSDGKIQTRVSNLAPNEIKSYSLPVNTEIYIADNKQEAFAMKGNDIKATGVKPYIVVKNSDAQRVVLLSSLGQTPKTALKTWRESTDGMKFTNWESSPIGQKVHAGAIKINRAIRGNAQLVGVVTSLSLPEGSSLGFGIMVNIQGDDYILAFGGETEQEFDALRNLQVNDKIIIKSHHVSKAPKYAFAILSPSYVTQGPKLVYKRVQVKGGC